MNALQDQTYLAQAGAPPRPLPRRGSLVRWSSWAAVGLTALLAGLFVVQIGSFEALKPPSPGLEAAGVRADRVSVEGSTITGFDKDDQPYSVSAEGAAQDASDPSLVHLRRVNAAMQRASGEALRLEAGAALYNRETETLDLDGTVKLISSDRFIADMPRARVTLRDKRFRSEDSVSVALDNGTIAANGLEITEDGDRIVFFNGVKATFRPKDQRGTEP